VIFLGMGGNRSVAEVSGLPFRGEGEKKKKRQDSAFRFSEKKSNFPSNRSAPKKRSEGGKGGGREKEKETKKNVDQPKLFPNKRFILENDGKKKGGGGKKKGGERRAAGLIWAPPPSTGKTFPDAENRGKKGEELALIFKAAPEEVTDNGEV